MTKRIAAAILIALGVAAGTGAVAASGTDAPVAAAPTVLYHG